MSLIPNLLRAFCREFEGVREKLTDPCGGVTFRDGLSAEDGKRFAAMLSETAERINAVELACHVCQEKKVIQLEWYYAGGQDRLDTWIPFCVISGRRVKQKNSGREVHVCYNCLRGKDQLRERVAKMMEPILQRFDELSL
jgi:hypothetical protein